ncbi:140_t:CDS:2, partial [Gigaspora rosea]
GGKWVHCSCVCWQYEDPLESDFNRSGGVVKACGEGCRIIGEFAELYDLGIRKNPDELPNYEKTQKSYPFTEKQVGAKIRGKRITEEFCGEICIASQRREERNTYKNTFRNPSLVLLKVKGNFARVSSWPQSDQCSLL